MMTRPQLRAVLMLVMWGVVWNVAWNWFSRPRPVTRIDLPLTAALLSVSDTGLASVTMDARTPTVKQKSVAKVLDMKTGLECPLPYRPGDVPLGYGLSYQLPCFVLRDGCVHLIDAITGETLQRHEELRSATRVLASPDRLRLLVQSTPTSHDLFDVTTRKVLWSYAPPDPGSIYWSNNEFVSEVDFIRNRSVLIDATKGSPAQCPTVDTPYQIAKIDGQFIAIDRFGTIGLHVKNFETNQLLATLSFSDRQLDSPNREQIRFSDDRTSVLIDYVDRSGKVATVKWDMTDQTLDERYTLAPFTVAANGAVLEHRAIEPPRWLKNIRWDVLSVLGLSRRWKQYSSVFNSNGALLLRVVQTSDNIFYSGQYQTLTNGGQGLVVYNKQGLEYYRIPTAGPAWFPYWLGLLAPPLSWWGIRRIRKSNSPPATMTV